MQDLELEFVVDIGVVSRTLAAYLELLEGEEEGNQPAISLLQLTTTSWSCLICLSTVRRIDAVWNCDQCGCMFHLVCVQQWAKDSLALPPSPSPLSPHLFPDVAATRTWSCPKCRKDYLHSQVPTLYYCFCRKKVCVCVSVNYFLFVYIVHAISLALLSCCR